jgi:dihydroxyacetone kinase
MSPESWRNTQQATIVVRRYLIGIYVPSLSGAGMVIILTDAVPTAVSLIISKAYAWCGAGK